MREVIIIFLNDRRKQLLFELLNKNQCMEIDKISKKYGVSERTTRYDIEAIEGFLKEHNLPLLVKKRDGQISFPEDMKERERVVDFLNDLGSDICDSILPSNQRIFCILNGLLLSDGFSTINNLAGIISVSRNTVIGDLDKIKKWLQESSIELKSIPKHGLKVYGKEKSIRNALQKLYKEALNFDQYIELTKDSLAINDINKYPQILYARLFNDINVCDIHKCIKDMQGELKVVFSDVTYVELTICIAIGIQRLRMNKTLIMDKEEISLLRDTSAFSATATIAKRLSEYYKIHFTTDEIAYITQYVLAGNMLTTTIYNERTTKLYTQMLISNLIANASKLLNIDLTDDWQLFSCLYIELSSVIYRQEHNIKAYNPYLKDIRDNYPKVFNAVKSSIGSLQDYAGVKVDDREIGFLSLHFATCMEKYSQVNVLIVCGTGFGTANLLSIKLKSIFNVNIVGAVAVHDVVSTISKYKVDLIVTTMPLTFGEIPCILVNPTLLPEDALKIREYIIQNQQKKISNNNQKYFDCVDIMKTCNEVCESRHFNNINTNSQNIRSMFPSGLKEILTPDNIRLNVCAKNWKDAVQYAGDILYKNGCVDKPYIKSLIDMIEEFGPYIVFWKGVALPHSDKIEYVHKLSASFIRLSEPVNFGNKKNDPVDMIFVFATPNKECHVNAMMQLSDLLSSREMVDRLKDQKDIGGVLQIINSIN